MSLIKNLIFDFFYNFSIFEGAMKKYLGIWKLENLNSSERIKILILNKIRSFVRLSEGNPKFYFRVKI